MKRTGPEQLAILRDIERARVKVDRAKQAYDEALGELHNHVRRGFANNVSGLKLSEYSKLSPPRVYQIRDESPQPAQER